MTNTTKEKKYRTKIIRLNDVLLVAEFEGDIILTLQRHIGQKNGLFVAEAKNGLIAIGAFGNEAFFNLGMAYRNAGLVDY